MMSKQIWIGGGLGVLVLALMAGSFWVADRTTKVAAPAPNSARAGLGTTAPPPPAMPAAPSLGEQAPQAMPSAPQGMPASGKSTLTLKERKARLAELRVELNTLRAQGLKASPARMRALVDELELMSEGVDARYYQALRGMLDSNTKVQALSAELESLGKSNAPKDIARQQALLAEMRAIGEDVQRDAQTLQAYAASAAAGAKKP